MTEPRRIYLDNAATSWPKPESVYDAVDHYLREIGAPNGRSGYRKREESNRIVDRARRGVAALIGARDPSHVVFGFNCTDVLNMAIRGIVRPGDHVVTTVCDHNSVLRPLRALREESGVEVTYVPCDGQGYLSPDDVRAALRPEYAARGGQSCLERHRAPSNRSTKSAASSREQRVLPGRCRPIAGPRADRCADLRSRSAGRTGPQGFVGTARNRRALHSPGRRAQLKPLRCGGTGTQSDEDRQPDVLPDKYEPGNHNLAGLAGLAAATEFLRDETIEAIHAHHTQLVSPIAWTGCAKSMPSASTGRSRPPTAPASSASRSTATTRRNWPQCSESAFGIQCRAGFQCAPRMHESLGTTAGGGTLRFSPGYATTIEEIDFVISALQEVASVAGALRTE